MLKIEFATDPSYIYGLKPINFDKQNCDYQINKKQAQVCFGNYPNQNLNNQIPEDVWTAIKSFTETTSNAKPIN
ncbi:hypothetical protein L3V82_07180 [Thiotrichales bacterium 19S3-7]|nr:hypothetical protein [Thiotrichales bacterium 19S3-7]MCF6801941.1 hypothetical protein [Thiotrichales bacterium 19S3-11]